MERERKSTERNVESGGIEPEGKPAFASNESITKKTKQARLEMNNVYKLV